MKNKIGVVVSDKMNNSATIVVTYTVKHPLYKKIMKRTKKFTVENKIGAKIGQKVKIIETKPVAKTITHKIMEILS